MQQQQHSAKLQQIVQLLDSRKPKQALKLADEALIRNPDDNALKSVKCIALVQSNPPNHSLKNLESLKNTVLPILDTIINQQPYPKVNDSVINQVMSALKLLGECKYFVCLLIHTFLVF